MRFAGCAEAFRRRIPVLFLVTALTGTGSAALAQTADAQRWYEQGLAELRQGRAQQAQESFRRAVEADPSFAGAWLDLAIAAHAAGNVAQAEEFLGILESRFTLPDGLVRGVAALRVQIRETLTAAPATWAWSRSAQAAVGHDTNANAGLAVGDLTLTFPGGGITLPLAPEFRPRADTFASAHLAVEGAKRLAEGQIELSAAVRTRRNFAVHDFDTLELQSDIGYASNEPLFGGVLGPWLSGPWRVGAAMQHARLGGNALFNAASLSVAHVWRGRCDPQAAVELNVRRFPSAANLDGHLLWLGAGAFCPTEAPGPKAGWKVQGRVGHEWARNAYEAANGRPGGNTVHAELSLARQWAWQGEGGEHRVEAAAQWAGAWDSKGYSPLLGDNARRSIQRWQWGGSYTFPLGRWARAADGWVGILSYQKYLQRANLDLFRADGQTVQFAVRKAF